MPRQIPKTEKITAMLEEIVGAGSDLSNLAVFEWAAFNTLPVSQNSIFDGSKATKTMLTEMVEQVKSTKYVPLLTMHDGRMLPVGRVFDAETVDRRHEFTGETFSELRVLFYISTGTPEGVSYVDRIDTGIIDEVSIGAAPAHMRCSACGWDYKAEANILNWIDQTCANDHTIGEDGVHLILDGLDSWKELSLVNRGAAQSARNVKPSDSLLASARERASLYAETGIDPKTLIFCVKGKEAPMYLTAAERLTIVERIKTQAARLIELKDEAVLASLTKLETGEELTLEDCQAISNEIDTKVTAFEAANPVAPATPAKVEVPTLTLEAHIELKAKSLVAEEKIVELTQVKTTLEAANTELKTQLEVALAAVQEHEAVKTEAALAAEFLKASAKNLLTAAGIKTEAVEDVAGLIEQIKQANATLSALPVGGVATLRLEADAEDPAKRQTKASTSGTSAFKSKK